MMAANRRTVGPKVGGGWQLTGGASDREFYSQATAEAAAREELLSSGGGELLVKGRDGKVRSQNTIGRKDPRSSTG
jgi:hypothetical protein